PDSSWRKYRRSVTTACYETARRIVTRSTKLSAVALAPDRTENRSRFERQLTLEPDRSSPGRYRGAIDEAWNCPIVPHGGLVTAVAARAMADELAHPDQPLRSITAVFAGQVRPGPVEVGVTV